MTHWLEHFYTFDNGYHAETITATRESDFIQDWYMFVARFAHMQISLQISDIIGLSNDDTDILPPHAIWAMMLQYLSLVKSNQETNNIIPATYIHNIEKLLRYDVKKLLQWVQRYNDRSKIDYNSISWNKLVARDNMKEMQVKLLKIIAEYYFQNYIDSTNLAHQSLQLSRSPYLDQKEQESLEKIASESTIRWENFWLDKFYGIYRSLGSSNAKLVFRTVVENAYQKWDINQYTYNFLLRDINKWYEKTSN